MVEGRERQRPEVWAYLYSNFSNRYESTDETNLLHSSNYCNLTGGDYQFVKFIKRIVKTNQRNVICATSQSFVETVIWTNNDNEQESTSTV